MGRSLTLLLAVYPYTFTAAKRDILFVLPESQGLGSYFRQAIILRSSVLVDLHNSESSLDFSLTLFVVHAIYHYRPARFWDGGNHGDFDQGQYGEFSRSSGQNVHLDDGLSHKTYIVTMCQNVVGQ